MWNQTTNSVFTVLIMEIFPTLGNVLGKATASNIQGKIDKIELGREEVLLEVASKYNMLYPLSTAEQCAPKCSSWKPQKFIIFMILPVGWMALLLVSPELPHGAVFSWCVAGGLCLAGAAGMAGSFSLCTLLSQEGLVELLYRVSRVPSVGRGQLQDFMGSRFKNLYSVTYTTFYLLKQATRSAHG